MPIPTIDPQTALDVLGTVTGAQDPQLFLAVGGTVFARTLGFMMVAPFFGGMNIPMTARVGFALVLTTVITPYADHVIAPVLERELAGGGSLTYLLLLGNQVLVGLMLAFVAAFIFYAIESAGRIIDTQRGSNITDIVAPQTGERTSPSGQFLNMFAIMVLIISGLHMVMIEGFINSFEVFPPTLGLEWLGDPLHASTAHPEVTGVVKEFAELSGASLQLTLQIAAPAMIALLFTDVLLGIINRGAPQVNVFALSQLVKGPIAIAAMMAALIPTWNYLQGDAIPSVVEGNHSIPAMAQRMRESDNTARSLKAEEDQARQAALDGGVTRADG